MEEFLPVVKELGLGVTMVVYLMYMFNRQNKQREIDFAAQIKRWEAHEVTLNDRIDKLEKHNMEQDKYIRETLAELIKETHEYFKRMDHTLNRLCEKIGDIKAVERSIN